jgi:hypothetical protein
MSCPSEISEILLAIVETGLLRIRSLAWSGRSGLCATEADHIHNLPALVADFSPETLRYYWEVERSSYIDRTSHDQLTAWELLWQRLRPHAECLDAMTQTR